MSKYGACVITEMSFDDIPDVIELEKETFSSPWSAELFRYELMRRDATIYMVGTAAGRLVGYVGAQVLGQEVHITNMAVRLSSRRAGLGSAMLLDCIRRGIEKGARWVTLEVRRGNDEAHEFYKTFGFEDLGLRRGYYTDSGEDAIIMATGDIRSEDFNMTMRHIESVLLDKQAGGGPSC